ncbi:MAG: hypothetical protein HY898_16975 [Deltaproteobacteria bacterium]|nr:hypothetical protein [Deltaproteobacteria bacterium]
MRLSAVAFVLSALLAACSSSDSGPAGGGGSAGGSSSDACKNACLKIQNQCSGTCNISGGSDCSGKAKEWADCINAKPCADHASCNDILIGGTGGSGTGGAGVGGAGVGGTGVGGAGVGGAGVGGTGVGGAGVGGAGVGGTGVGGTGGGGTDACATLADKCDSCTDETMATTCATTVASAQEAACQSLLDQPQFQAACP